MIQIFKSYSDFLKREDKELNGVSEQFAADHPKWEKENKTNDGCWNCSDCSRCLDCSDCSDCLGCSDCSRCSNCSDCLDCSNCSDCSDLEYAAPTKSTEAGFKVPVIENIHQKVLAAVSNPNAFNMTSFHTCETTRCWAGWVVHLAGDAGYELEKRTSSVFAAMQIIDKSSEIKVSPPRFFEDNNTAMEYIKQCASQEIMLKHL